MYEYSDNDDDHTFTAPSATWQEFRLAFGKHKGRKLGEMVRTSGTRRYLRYILGWDQLRSATRAKIESALADYEEKKKQHAMRPEPSSPIHPSMCESVDALSVPVIQRSKSNHFK